MTESNKAKMRQMMYPIIKGAYPLDDNNEMIWIDCCRVLKTEANDETKTFTTTLVEELSDSSENHEKLRDKYGRDKWSVCKLYKQDYDHTDDPSWRGDPYRDW